MEKILKLNDEIHQKLMELEDELEKFVEEYRVHQDDIATARAIIEERGIEIIDKLGGDNEEEKEGGADAPPFTLRRRHRLMMLRSFLMRNYPKSSQ